MTQAPKENIVEVKPTPSVYTVLMIISILFLGTAIGFVGNRLMAPTDAPNNKVGGYGMEIGDMFAPISDFRKREDPKSRQKVEARLQKAERGN